jgi:pantothenate kinase
MDGLKNRVQTLEAKLESTKKRLAYLESMKEDVESQENGDLILHLTQLLSDKKDENEKLKAEKAELLRQIGELRRRN